MSHPSPVDIAALQSLMKEGRISEVRAALAELRNRRPKRQDLVPLANLARRAGNAELSIRLLNPIVRGDRKRLFDPTEAEKTEYAAALTRIGASQEALGILRDLDAKSDPTVRLIRSLAYFSRWEYGAAEPELRQFSGAMPKSDYLWLVGLVNWVAALIFLRKFGEAEPLLAEAKKAARERGANLLFANCLELSAQLSIARRRFVKAQEELQEASRFLAQSEILDEFFVRKWEAVLALMRDGPTSSSLLAISRVREAAAGRSHWETVRDCDFYRARESEDADCLQHLFFGTPYAGYRDRIRDEISAAREFPETYVWKLGPSGRRPRILDLASARDLEAQGLRCGMLIERCLRVLASDFYRPFRVTSLFAALFPGEFYHPVHSSQRLHQLFKRLRGWFDERGLPFEVKESRGNYNLTASASAAVTVPLKAYSPGRLAHELARAERAIGVRVFTISEAIASTGQPRRTVQRLLGEAVSGDLVERSGTGRSTRYRFKSR